MRAVRWAGVAVLGWSVDALVTTMQYRTMVLQQGAPTPEWGPLLLTNFASSLLWVPLTVMILWLSYRWPVTGGARSWLVHVGSFVVVVVVRAVAVVLLNPWVRWYSLEPPPFGDLLTASLFNNLVVFVFVTGLAHAVFLRAAVRRSEELLASARIDALTAQLQPHFLFNALNTIAARVHAQPDVAERMVVDLGGLLRHSVSRDHRRLVPLDEELDIAMAYLRIEEHRFEDRLRVTVDVDDDVRETLVPPFILQPLVENAVRHGLAPRVGLSHLEIRARREGSAVRIDVVDDGLGLPDGDAGLPVGETGTRGVGLTNVASRLREAFGGNASLGIERGPSRGVVATIRVPQRGTRLGALGTAAAESAESAALEEAQR